MRARTDGAAPAGSLASIQIRRRAPAAQKPARSQPAAPSDTPDTQTLPETAPAPAVADQAPAPTRPPEPCRPEPHDSDPPSETAAAAPAEETAEAASEVTPAEAASGDGPADAATGDGPAESAPAEEPTETVPADGSYGSAEDDQEIESNTAPGSWARRLARATARPPAPSRSARETTAPRVPAEPRRQDPGGIEGLVAYWSDLRSGRSFPNARDLDYRRLAAEWPNCILLRRRDGSKVLEPEMTFSGPSQTMPEQAGDEPAGAVKFSPMMLQWLISLAGEALRNKSPVEDTEAFPSARSSVQYRAIALPLNEDEKRNSHVLCHVRLAG